jgi:hypothetical protein
MRKRKKGSSKKKNQPLKPTLKWQKGEYTRYAKFETILPYQFLLLCRLVDVTPETVVRDFMDNLSCGSWKREGRDKAKEYLIEYFIAHRYGQENYTEDQIRQMFREMDALGLLFPKNGKSKLLDLYADWRNAHHTYWFKKWFHKPRRKLSGGSKI